MASGNKVVFQPYKINANDWNIVKDHIRIAGDKAVYTVVIGTRIEKAQDDMVLKEEPVTEEVFEEVLKGIFTQSDYEVRVRLGREPNLIVTYNGELLPHNDKIDGYMSRLCAAFGQFEKSEAVAMLINGVLNVSIQERLTAESQRFVEKVNGICRSNHSPEFIVESLKKYFCEDLRRFDLPGAGDLHYAGYEELLRTAGEVVIGRLKGTFDENLEEVLLDELLYRFLCGNLVGR